MATNYEGNSAYGQTYFNNKLNLNRLSLLPKHNFAKFAESLGVESCQVTKPEELEHAILKAMEFKGTYLIDVIVGHEYPAPIYDYKEQMSKLYRV